VIVWMVPRVGKLLPCWEDSWFCGGGGSGLFGSVFCWIIWVFAVGYVICRGQRVSDGWLSCMGLACVWGVVV
jgi:hypothetical protein